MGTITHSLIFFLDVLRKQTKCNNNEVGDVLISFHDDDYDDDDEGRVT